MTDQERAEVEEIAFALRGLLVAAMAALNDPFDKPRGPMSLGEIGQLYRGRSEVGRATVDIIEHPVGYALRRAIRTLGERLFEIGGTQLMRTVLTDVAEFGGADEDRWTDIMDKRWDRIGDEKDFWLA